MTCTLKKVHCKRTFELPKWIVRLWNRTRRYGMGSRGVAVHVPSMIDFHSMWIRCYACTILRGRLTQLPTSNSLNDSPAKWLCGWKWIYLILSNKFLGWNHFLELREYFFLALDSLVHLRESQSRITFLENQCLAEPLILAGLPPLVQGHHRLPPVRPPPCCLDQAPVSSICALYQASYGKAQLMDPRRWKSMEEERVCRLPTPFFCARIQTLLEMTIALLPPLSPLAGRDPGSLETTLH
jgi:hypothetical protein